MIIYLTGYMGSGKSRYGKLAARRLGYGFMDLDELIEEDAGMSISELFSQKGEDYFRQKERSVLMETLPGVDTIIATGGGTYCSEENLRFMKSHGRVVYLRLPTEVLASRLKILAPTRPLLTPHLDNLQEFVASHLMEREAWYLQADLTVEGKGLTGKKLAEALRTLIS
ncbi:MAG TPA: shikimate kinase [Bacteroidales bacterium]|nr:shikimate kinase [Bacteroidales bacterium]HRZ49307.1 shikimate kinase [Bacteroidales bacterium]